MTNKSQEKKERILITGSQGLIGTRLVQQFAPQYDVIGLDIEDATDFEGSAHYRCDLTDDAAVEETLGKYRDSFGDRIASVIHLAAYYDFSGKPSPLYKELTVKGTQRLIRALRAFDVEQFVFSSSLLAMKPVEDNERPLTETSETRAEWAYPQSKLEAEEVLREEHGSIPVVVLRVAGVYDDRCHSLPISQHIRRIFERKLESYVFPGDAEHGQPFVHLEDLAACFESAVRHRASLENWELFLIAEPTVLSHHELQELLGQLIHGEKWPTIRIPKPLAKAGAKAKELLVSEEQFIKPWMIDLADDHYPVEIRRARERLKWVPAHNLRSGLKAMTDFLREYPKNFYLLNELDVPDNLEALCRDAGRPVATP